MIAIHQSQFLSWSPFFYKVLSSDSFVVMDDVQFQKNGVQNRNQIKTPQGESWLTVPVIYRLETPINEVTIHEAGIYKKLGKTLELNYKKAPYFDVVYQGISAIFDQQIKNLHELNNQLFLYILSLLQSKANINYTSEINTQGKKDDLVIEIIRASGDLEYLTGSGGVGYMDLEKFKRHGIKVYTYKFEYNEYPQLWMKQTAFIRNLSVIDLLFNDLDNAVTYIRGQGNISRLI